MTKLNVYMHLSACWKNTLKGKYMKFEDDSNLKDHRGKGKSRQCGRSNRTRLTFVYVYVCFYIVFFLHRKCCYFHQVQTTSEWGVIRSGTNMERVYLPLNAFVMFFGKTACWVVFDNMCYMLVELLIRLHWSILHSPGFRFGWNLLYRYMER